jgi:hypothetical protein
MGTPEDIIKKITLLFPPELQPSAYSIARIVTEASNNTLSVQEAKVLLLGQPDLHTVLSSLTGKTIEDSNLRVAFGTNGNMGDVTIRNIVGGNQVTLTINIYNDDTGSTKIGTETNKGRGPLAKLVDLFSEKDENKRWSRARNKAYSDFRDEFQAHGLVKNAKLASVQRDGEREILTVLLYDVDIEAFAKGKEKGNLLAIYKITIDINGTRVGWKMEKPKL